MTLCVATHLQGIKNDNSFAHTNWHYFCGLLPSLSLCFCVIQFCSMCMKRTCNLSTFCKTFIAFIIHMSFSLFEVEQIAPIGCLLQCTFNLKATVFKIPTCLLHIPLEEQVYFSYTLSLHSTWKHVLLDSQCNEQGSFISFLPRISCRNHCYHISKRWNLSC